MLVFPQDPPFQLQEIVNFQRGLVSLSILKTGLHAGTHLDAPYHFHSSGKKIHELKLEELMGYSLIIDIKGKEIRPKDLKSIGNYEIIIFRTRWSEKWGKEEYYKDNPYLSLETADIIVKSSLKGIGIDGPSVDAPGETQIHEKLLNHDKWIVENLTNLDKIKSRKFEVYFIPLFLEGEASPIRGFAKI